MTVREIAPTHPDGSPHVPDWETLALVPHDRHLPIFDVWCKECGQSGSFSLPEIEVEIQWYP